MLPKKSMNAGVRARGECLKKLGIVGIEPGKHGNREESALPKDAYPEVEATLAVKLRRKLLFGAYERKEPRREDGWQHAVSASVAIDLDPVSALTASIIGDSSVESAGVRYAIVNRLRKEGIVVMRMLCIPGAKAADLAAEWEKTQQSSFAMTIYNGNDFLSTDAESANFDSEIQGLADATRRKASLKAMVFMNDASFFPRMKPHYAKKMEEARKVVRERNCEVHTGSRFVDKIKLRDNLHFKASCLEDVAAMFAQPLEDHMKKQESLKASKRTETFDAQQSPNTTVEDSDAHDTETETLVWKDENVEYSPQRPDDKQAAVERRKDLIKRIRGDANTRKAEFDKLVLQATFTRCPPVLDVNDTRFAPCKKDRKFYCDGCGRTVTQSRLHKNGSLRSDGNLQGSYKDKSWANLFAARFQKEAWQEGLIDAMWFCARVCKYPATGMEDRQTRPRRWREMRYQYGLRP